MGPARSHSQAVPPDQFEQVKQDNGHSEGSVQENRNRAARHAADFALTVVGASASEVTVHNVNYPALVTAETVMEKTQLGFTRLGSLFAPHEGGFEFAFPVERTPVFNPENADIRCLQRGHISHTIVEYARARGPA